MAIKIHHHGQRGNVLTRLWDKLLRWDAAISAEPWDTLDRRVSALETCLATLSARDLQAGTGQAARSRLATEQVRKAGQIAAP
jgi:hypothetical protein